MATPLHVYDKKGLKALWDADDRPEIQKGKSPEAYNLAVRSSFINDLRKLLGPEWDAEAGVDGWTVSAVAYEDDVRFTVMPADTSERTEREMLRDVSLNQEKYIEYMSERNPNMIFENPKFPDQSFGWSGDPGNRKQVPKTHRAVWNATKQTYEALPVNGLTTDVQWSRPYENSKGQLQVMDMNNPENIMVLDDSISLSRTPPDFSQDDTDPVTSLQLADGSTVQYFMVGGKLVQYRSTEKAADDPVDPGTDQIDVKGGTFYKTAPNKYDFVRDPDVPFVPSQERQVPGGMMIQTSPNQWQFVRDTYEPGVKIDRTTGIRFTQDPTGTWREMSHQYTPGLVQLGDRTYVRQYTGALEEQTRQFDPGVIRDPSGLTLIQQPTGAVTQARAANMDEIITQALIDGQVEKALAFQAFRDRPTAQEAFDTALEYARSPADQQVISSLARGETPVREPDAGVIQRVGPRPDFLVQAYQDFQRRTQTGRAPTEEEAQQLTERYATGQSPTTDKLMIEKQTLEARLEKIALDTEIAREKHQAEMSQRQELHNTKIRELTQKVNNAQEKARLEQEYIENQRYGNGGNGGGAATGNGTRTTSGSQPDNTLADANVSYNTSTRAITVEDENGVETTFKNIDELMKAATGETDLYNVTHPSRDAGTGTNYDTGRALQVLKTQGLKDAIAYTENQMQRAKETMYADVGGPWGVQIPWNHWAIQEYGESEEGLKNFQDDAA